MSERYGVFVNGSRIAVFADKGDASDYRDEREASAGDLTDSFEMVEFPPMPDIDRERLARAGFKAFDCLATWEEYDPLGWLRAVDAILAEQAAIAREKTDG